MKCACKCAGSSRTPADGSSTASADGQSGDEILPIQMDTMQTSRANPFPYYRKKAEARAAASAAGKDAEAAVYGDFDGELGS